MACGCGGRSRKTMTITTPTAGGSASSSEDMVLLSYEGPGDQQVSVKSKAMRGVKYTYSKGKKFWAYRQDADWLLQNKYFQVAAEAPVVSNLRAETPVLTAETREAPVSSVPEISVDELNIPPLVRGILKREGFLTVESVKYATDPELLATKGISDARLKQIRKAINAFSK